MSIDEGMLWPPPGEENYYEELIRWHGPVYDISRDEDKESIEESIIYSIRQAQPTASSHEQQGDTADWTLITIEEGQKRIRHVLEDAASKARDEKQDPNRTIYGGLPHSLLSDRVEFAKALEGLVTTETSRKMLREVIDGADSDKSPEPDRL